MGTGHYYFELGDVEYFEDVVGVLVRRLAAYFTRRFVLGIYLDDSVPSYRDHF